MRTGHLPDWSSPDDPARVLAAVGRLNPSVYKMLCIHIVSSLACSWLIYICAAVERVDNKGCERWKCQEHLWRLVTDVVARKYYVGKAPLLAVSEIKVQIFGPCRGDSYAVKYHVKKYTT